MIHESVDTSSSNANCYHIFYSIEHLISGYIQQWNPWNQCLTNIDETTVTVRANGGVN